MKNTVRAGLLFALLAGTAHASPPVPAAAFPITPSSPNGSATFAYGAIDLWFDETDFSACSGGVVSASCLGTPKPASQSKPFPVTIISGGGGGGGSNAAAGTIGIAPPTSGGYTAFMNAGGNLTGVSPTNPLPITGSISASNPSVSATGATAPGSATLNGFVNGSGNQTAVSPSNPFPVTATSAVNAFPDGWNLTAGTKADSAYTGTGSASEIAILKGLFASLGSPMQAGGTATLTGNLPAFTATPTFNVGAPNYNASGGCTAYTVTTGNTAVTFITGPIKSGIITNPLTATGQGIATAEVEYVALGVTATTTEGGQVFALQPGQTFTVPALATAQVVSVNAATSAHKSSCVVFN